MADIKIPDEYISIIQVLREDKVYESWLEELGNLPDNLRFMELHKLISEMKRNREDEKVISFMESLKNRDFYDAVVKTKNKSEKK